MLDPGKRGGHQRDEQVEHDQHNENLVSSPNVHTNIVSNAFYPFNRPLVNPGTNGQVWSLTYITFLDFFTAFRREKQLKKTSVASSFLVTI